MIIAGVAVFLLILTVSGVISARRVRGDCSNYLVAGRALPAVLVTAVLIAQPVDSNATIGNADLSAAFGFWAGAALPIGLAVCLLLMGLFFAKRMRAADVVTLPEYFRNRFGRSTEVASSCLTIASFVILLAGNLVAVGFLLERFLGVSYGYAIILTIPLALLYTISGGMFASVYTGVACVIVNVIGVAALVTWVATTHGFSAPEGMGAGDIAQLTSSDSGAVINWATIIALGLGNLVAIDLMQRVFSARTPGGAQKACFAAAAGLLMLCIPLSFVALAAVSIVGDDVTDGPILYTLLGGYAPAWLAIIVISGLLAATLTTISGILLSTAAVLIRNVLCIDAQAVTMTPRVLTATRWATLPMAVLAGIVALRVPQTGILLTLAFDIVTRDEIHRDANVRLLLTRALARCAGIGGMAFVQLVTLQREPAAPAREPGGGDHAEAGKARGGEGEVEIGVGGHDVLRQTRFLSRSCSTSRSRRLAPVSVSVMTRSSTWMRSFSERISSRSMRLSASSRLVST